MHKEQPGDFFNQVCSFLLEHRCQTSPPPHWPALLSGHPSCRRCDPRTAAMWTGNEQPALGDLPGARWDSCACLHQELRDQETSTKLWTLQVAGNSRLGGRQGRCRCLHWNPAACDNLMHVPLILILFQFIHFPVFWVIEFVHEFDNRQHHVHCKYEHSAEQIAVVQDCWYNANMLIAAGVSAREKSRNYPFWEMFFIFFPPMLFTVHRSLMKTVRAEIAKGTEPQICLKSFPEWSREHL